MKPDAHSPASAWTGSWWFGLASGPTPAGEVGSFLARSTAGSGVVRHGTPGLCHLTE
jgi:hypothetical protein